MPRISAEDAEKTCVLLGFAEGGGLRLDGYTSINSRSPFYSEGEASDGKILNLQYNFWRMLRPYGILA